MQVRPATPEDAAAIAAVYAHYVTRTAATFEDDVPDSDEMARRMLLAPRLPWFVAERDTVVGFAYASAHRARSGYRWSVDVSVYLDPSETGRGTGPALYDLLLPEVAALGYISVFAGIALPNPASVRLHEAKGFTSVGVFHDVGFKLGGWRDVGWWQRPLRPATDPPVEPRPWDPTP